MPPIRRHADAGRSPAGGARNTAPARNSALTKNMARVPVGQFLMGSDAQYREERPAHWQSAGTFWVDQHPVTNAEFRRFVNDTGWITTAERAPDDADFPDANPGDLVAGSLVFEPTPGPVPLDDWRRWWAWTPGADWRHPLGPASGLAGLERHPVVHVSYEDALAYAAWAGKALPTEAEWEYAARGGLEGATFSWGDDFAPKGRMMANTWQGEFPWENVRADGNEGTSPVRSFPANGYGLYDMTGNVWEWTSDYYAPRGAGAETPRHACCGPPRNPQVKTADDSYDVGRPGAHIPRRVIKGGSHLCAPSYCLRYRPAARQPEAIDTSTSHIGFRCVRR